MDDSNLAFGFKVKRDGRLVGWLERSEFCWEYVPVSKTDDVLYFNSLKDAKAAISGSIPHVFVPRHY